MTFLIVITLFWVIPIVVAQMIGRKLGRKHPWLWGLFLGWLGVFVLAVSNWFVRLTEREVPGITKGATNVLKNVAAPTKKCPECAEAVQEAANVCKHCGHRFEVVASLEA